MASLQKKGDCWYCQFVYKKQRYTQSLGRIDEIEAAGCKGRYEQLLWLLKQNLLTVPAGVDICTFLQFDGKPPEKAVPVKQEVTLGALRDDYLRTHRSSLEANTVVTIELHFRHLCAFLGEKYPINLLGLADLQRYVQSREGNVQSGTIKMEIVTLRTAWNWGVRYGFVSGPFPSKGLRYPKGKEKPPFMTWAEAERRIEQGGDSEELWDCL